MRNNTNTKTIASNIFNAGQWVQKVKTTFIIFSYKGKYLNAIPQEYSLLLTYSSA